MTDIELVIKIPEDSYEATCNGCMLSQDVKNVVEAIKNGTSFPKGHGKIIDADYAIKQLLSLPKNELSTEDMWAMKVLDLAPTIIEADKSESEVEDDDK